MNAPTSTYRLQFRGNLTFGRAIELVPYLKDLGISHIYASPIFTALTGSTHGYDVTDPNQIDPVLGGQAGFVAFAAALRRAGLGLILDIVPNHMAASVENAWWRDILRHGPNSAYAGYFDVDWSRKLTLPKLGKPFDEALSSGEFKLRLDSTSELMQLVYFDSWFPLSDDSVAQVLAETGRDAEQLEAFSSKTAGMKELLEKQHWQLLYWKDAVRNLSYRRFFEVAELVGLRVEDEQVFQETHRLVIELVRAGQVQGLRIDHIDGLADPGTYLNRLRQAVGPDTFIIVEKILSYGETLPANWPVSGTTGYEFISAMSNLFISEDGLRRIGRAYEIVGKEHADFSMGLRNAKLLLVERSFAGEMGRLAKLAHLLLPDIDQAEISLALRELLIAFPVYRTYGCQGALSAEDEAVLGGAIGRAQSKLPTTAALGAIGGLLRGATAGAEAKEFRTRFQQLSGPVMAKSAEDTLFYRHNALIAMNEVGGQPSAVSGGASAFHGFMADRLRRQPCGLSATSTHDTKRGEDARARLYSLTQYPDVWVAGVERWRSMNVGHRSELADGPAPEPNIEWMLYQALAGIWPDDIDQSDRSKLSDRFAAYALKAIREAKLRTDWMNENPAYEKAVLYYAKALLSHDNNAFQGDFAQTLRPFIDLGYRNSLSQVLIKLAAPGIPDIYQGAEGFDFGMVDPDNRRPVDRQWAAARQTNKPAGSNAAWLKREIIRSVLHYRNDHPLLFLNGSYVPLETSGTRSDNLVAFARIFEREAAVTVVPRLVDAGNSGSDFWEDTRVVLTAQIDGRLRNILTGKPQPSGNLLAAELLADHPVAFLVRSI